MKVQLSTAMKTLTIISALFLSTVVLAQEAAREEKTEHKHDAEHSESTSSTIYDGYFDDDQIEPRELSDWQGDWQSLYPYLLDGTLDPVLTEKAEHGEKTVEQYRAYYETGYQTEVNRIEISADSLTFHTGDSSVTALYASDGFEILNYEAGNRGVRFVFSKQTGDEDAPDFIQFSDHSISPTKAGHYHLYWGDDRAALLEEVSNWPTYYPSSLSGEEIVDEMTSH